MLLWGPKGEIYDPILLTERLCCCALWFVVVKGLDDGVNLADLIYVVCIVAVWAVRA